MVPTKLLKKQNHKYTPTIKQENIFFLIFDVVTFVTRSSRRYCNTGATLGRGGTQAYQALSRGLNNPLKLL